MKSRHILMLVAGAAVALAAVPLAMAQNKGGAQTEPVKQGAAAQQAADADAQAQADARAQRRAAAAAQKDQARKGKQGVEEEEEGKPLR